MNTSQLKLQMNLKGAWRDVVSFAPAMEASIKTGAEQVFGHDQHVTLRIISPADSGPPLACWSAATGWRTWGERSLARDPAPTPAGPDPLLQARKDITLLRTALTNMVGARTSDELRNMEAFLRMLPLQNDQDKMISINAIQALLATMPQGASHADQA
ncbi:hypothetical protein [Rhodoferax sp. BLA1]|uniref:hypothetical protein n=1 Tax=Rhodoferax sp. BLA1 TaxID=2576062 RepID=UPI0015D43771|nr:hypothetical protein [Rhodoferax sp. BLA1]